MFKLLISSLLSSDSSCSCVMFDLLICTDFNSFLTNYDSFSAASMIMEFLCNFSRVKSRSFKSRFLSFFELHLLIFCSTILLLGSGN